MHRFRGMLTGHHRFAAAGLALLTSASLAACGATSSPAAPSPASARVSASASTAPAATSASGAASSEPSGSASSSASPSASATTGDGQLGMIFEVNNTGWQKVLSSPAQKGMVIVLVIPNQPGAKAGLTEGDVITKMNGVATNNANVANREIRKLKVGDKVTFDVARKNGPAKVDLTVDPAVQLNMPQMLDDQVKKDPKSAKAYLLRGAYGQKDAQAALADYNKAIEIAPDFVSAYVERGTLQQNTNADQAMKDFDKAASLDPNYEPLYVNRSVLFSLKKAYDRSLADDKKAVELDPTDPAAYANLGIGYINNDNPTEAMTAESKALELDPQFGPALFYRGLLERDASKADLQNAIRNLRDSSLRSTAEQTLQKMS